MMLWIAALVVAAQASSFEVASVKLVNPPVGPHMVSLVINHDRLNIDAAELRQIVGLAYGIQRVRVLGGPNWADFDQFDIVAKAESADATRDEIRSMLQTILAERFKLVMHRPAGERRTVFDSSSLKVLVNLLANTLGRPVVDKTGLDGLYDYTFEWPDAGSTLFTSVDELGLKLEAKKEPVEVLVIDRPQHPSAN